MVVLSERKVVAFFVGENVDLPRLSAVAHSCRNGVGDYSDCIEYAINVFSGEFMNRNRHFFRRFGQIGRPSRLRQDQRPFRAPFL